MIAPYKNGRIHTLSFGAVLILGHAKAKLVMLLSHEVVCDKKAEEQQRIQSPKAENAVGYCQQLNCLKRVLVKWYMSAYGDYENRSLTQSPFSHRKYKC